MAEEHVEFGSWLAAQRFGRRISTRQLEEWTGVSNATISRLERGKGQVTLPTAVLLCDGLEVPLRSMYEAVFRESPPPLLEPWRTTLNDGYILNISELAAFIGVYLGSREVAYRHLAAALTAAARAVGAGSDSIGVEAASFDVRDIQRFLYPSPLYRFELRYPDLGAEAILRIFRRNDCVTLTDAGAYVRARRKEAKESQVQLEKRIAPSAGVLSRLESGLLEHVKLLDLISLDREFGHRGDIFGMYWSAARLHLSLTGQAKEMNFLDHLPIKKHDTDLLTVVDLFITVYRWLEYASGKAGMDLGVLLADVRQLSDM